MSQATINPFSSLDTLLDKASSDAARHGVVATRSTIAGRPGLLFTKQEKAVKACRLGLFAVDADADDETGEAAGVPVGYVEAYMGLYRFPVAWYL